MSNMFYDHLSLFQGLTPQQRALVEPLFTTVSDCTGAVIYEQGDLAEFLYLLVEGEALSRFKPEDGPAITVAHVRPDSVLGWSSVLGSPEYTSSAVCATECLMLRVRGEDLRWLCEHHPEVGGIILERLAAGIAERLKSTHEYVIALLEQGLRSGAKDAS